MAQLGARFDGIEEVVGSNPIGSTKITFNFVRPQTCYSRKIQKETSEAKAKVAAAISQGLKPRPPKEAGCWAWFG